MCLAIPVRIEQIIDEDYAIAEVGGIKKKIVTSLIEQVSEGDYVILHVGYALSKLDQEQAQKTLDMLSKVIG